MRTIAKKLTYLVLLVVKPLVFALINSKPFLVSSRLFMRVFNPKRDIAVDVRGTTMYANSLDRLLALLFWKHSLVEGYEAALMERLVKPGMRVVNCGANIGYYTLHLARWVGREGEVIAFEPDPNCVRLLKKNAEANGLQNIKGEPLAVADKPSTRELYFCEENRGDHRLFNNEADREALQVQATSLDEYFPAGTRVDLIKMDIQGSELQALNGMTRVLSENPEAMVLSEFCPTLLEGSGASGAEFLSRLDELGYDVQFVNETKNRVEEMSSAELLRVCAKEYYCSIIARRREQISQAVGY